MYYVIDDNNEIYFCGSYFECDEWRERNCKDASRLDPVTLEEDEILLYKGKQVYIQKAG